MNPDFSIQSLLSFSWKKTKEALFPFRFKRWLKILFIVWLAGHAVGFGGNFNIPWRPQVPVEQSQEERQMEDVLEQTDEPGEQSSRSAKILEEEEIKVSQTTAEVLRSLPWALLVLSVVVGFSVIFIFLWLNARFNFILLDFLIHRDVRLRDSFTKNKAPGNSYFKWSLGFIAVSFGLILLVAGLMALAVLFAKILLLILIPLIFGLILSLGLTGIFVSDFVLPIMHRDGVSAMAGLKKFISIKPKFSSLAVYILLKLAFGVVVGLAIGFLALLLGIAALLIGLVVAFAGGFLVQAFGFLKTVFLVLGMLLGVLAIVLAVGFVAFAGLPASIFFRFFALSYLVRLSPEYNLLGIGGFNSKS